MVQFIYDYYTVYHIEIEINVLTPVALTFIVIVIGLVAETY